MNNQNAEHEYYLEHRALKLNLFMDEQVIQIQCHNHHRLQSF